MHHSTLTRCLTALGLSACTSAASETPAPRSPEPSGLGMDSHASAAPSESGSHFVSARDEWCHVSIDAKGRALQPTPSFLQAWNLVGEHGQEVTGYNIAPPTTEHDARRRICGKADCQIEQLQIFEASAHFGPAENQSVRQGLGVMVPSERGAFVVPVAGKLGDCQIAPQLRSTRSGSLVHVTAIVYEGRSDTFCKGVAYDYTSPKHCVEVCDVYTTARTDIVIDVEASQLELVLTRVDSYDPEQPVDVKLGPRAIELHGCFDVLELAWTGSTSEPQP